MARIDIQEILRIKNQIEGLRNLIPLLDWETVKNTLEKIVLNVESAGISYQTTTYRKLELLAQYTESYFRDKSKRLEASELTEQHSSDLTPNNQPIVIDSSPQPLQQSIDYHETKKPNNYVNYRGLIGRFYYYVNIGENDFIISKGKRNEMCQKVVTEWNFNESGRIKTLEAKLHYYSRDRLIEVTDNRISDWEIAKAHYQKIPHYLFRVFQSLQEKPTYTAQLQCLLGTGHMMAHNLLKGIREGTLTSPLHHLAPQEISLDDIYCNEKAIEMISNAASIFPLVKNAGQQTIIIKYVPNRLFNMLQDDNMLQDET